MEAAGYWCLRTAGSHGPVDVIATSRHHTIYIQCKVDCSPNPVEVETLEELPVPQSATKVFHLWRTGNRNPIIKTV